MAASAEKKYQGVENIVEDLKTLESLTKWDANDLVEAAGLVADTLKKNNPSLSTQIYRFLIAVRKIDLKTRGAGGKGDFKRREVVLLKPKFAYAVSRNKHLSPFYQVLAIALEKIPEDGAKGYDEFQQLVTFIESVVAYYDYSEEGKDYGRGQHSAARSTPRGQDSRSRPDPAAKRPPDRGRQGWDRDRRPR